MPKTLAKSKVLAETHLKKLHIDLQTPVENRLMISRSLNHSRLEKERSTSKKKEMQYCTFKPKTNNRRRQFSKENSFIGN